MKTGADAIIALIRDARAEYIKKYIIDPTVVMLHPESLHRILAQEEANTAVICFPKTFEGMTIISDPYFTDKTCVAVFCPLIKKLSKDKIAELGIDV